MKRLRNLVLLIAAGMLLIPLVVNAQSLPGKGEIPPIGQTLVREGDLAMKLVETYRLGTATNEAEAQSILSSVGVEPRNGWIADYPVTPDTVDELQNDIAAAADAARLPMVRNDALHLYQGVMAEFDLPVVAGAEREYEQVPGEPGYGPAPEPEVLNDYYYDEGPPVVTYYPPPPAYYPMYSWVPHPFAFSHFSFGGFFILKDFHRFDRVVVVNKNINKFVTRKLVTNRVLDPRTNRFVRLDARRNRGALARELTNRGRGTDRLLNRGDLERRNRLLSARGQNADRLLNRRDLERNRLQRNRDLRQRRALGNNDNLGLNNRRAAGRANLRERANRGNRALPAARRERLRGGLAAERRNDRLNLNNRGANRAELGRNQAVIRSPASERRARTFQSSGSNRGSAGRSNDFRSSGARRFEQRSLGNMRSFSSPSVRSGGSFRTPGNSGGGRAFRSGGSGSFGGGRAIRSGGSRSLGGARAFRSGGSGGFGGGRAFRSGGSGGRGGFARGGGGSRGGGCRRC